MMLLRRFALLLIGFTATAGQILLLREFIGTFNGNELVIGIYLSVWLIATAVGSGPVARLYIGGSRASSARSGADGAPVARFAAVQFLSGVCLLCAIVGLQVLPSRLRPAPGEVASLVTAFAAASVFLFPVCLLQGLLFPLGTRLLGSVQSSREGPGDSVSRVYFLESVGAGIGGLLFGLVLIRLMSVFQNIAILSALNLFTACFLLNESGRRRLSQILYLLAAVVVIVCVFDPITHWAASRRWKGFTVMALRQSHYGNLAIVSRDSQFSIYEDGYLVFTTDDVQSAEEAAHIPLLEHPAPAHVLLIGGGVGGVVREMFKHRTLTRLDYVELDPQLITLSKDVLPRRYVSYLEDSRVRVEHTDGRRFLQKTSERYDVVAMHIPSPYTAQLNRFYTKEFFALVRRHLNPGGVFVFSAPPVAEYVGQELGAFLGSLYRTSESVFESHIVIPAGRSFFVCSPGKNSYLTASPESLLSRLAERNVETFFVRDYFLMSTLSPERLAYVEKRISASKLCPVNTDLRPTSFYYDQVLWSAEYQRFMKGVLEWIFGNRWSLWAVTAAVAGVLPVLARSRKKSRLVLGALAISGFAAIVLELEILLCFQLLYGNLFDRIAVLLTAYMIGLAVGVVLERRGNHAAPAGLAVLRRPAVIQIATAALALCFLGFVYLVTGAASGSLGGEPGSHNFAAATVARVLVNAFEWFFPGLALVAGGLGGAMFSSASRAFFACDAEDDVTGVTASGENRPGGECFSTRDGHAGGVGITYAWDLAGSWFGAVLCSVVLFPVSGVAATITAVAVLLVVSGVSLAWASR